MNRYIFIDIRCHQLGFLAFGIPEHDRCSDIDTRVSPGNDTHYERKREVIDHGSSKDEE